jgi:cyclopropane-fatty-acyl-phospholipid synthase
MDKTLKPKNATAVVTCTARPESRYSGYQYVMSYTLLYSSDVPHFLDRSDDFSRKYIWPNSFLPSATVLISAVNTATQARFTVEGVENHSARK